MGIMVRQTSDERKEMGWIRWRSEDGQSGWERSAPSRGAEFTRSLTSAWVGFWPTARRRSPRVSRGTAPVPRLSKSANASLYSALSLCGDRDQWSRLDGQMGTHHDF